jgi:hypothetical protein
MDAEPLADSDQHLQEVHYLYQAADARMKHLQPRKLITVPSPGLTLNT